MGVETLPFSVTHLRAVSMLAGADLLIAAPDDNAARLCIAYAAAICLKPMLDIGTGIFGHGER